MTVNRADPRTALDGHIVVCGLGALGLGIVQELRLIGEDVVAIVRTAATDPAVPDRGVKIIEGNCRDEAVLRAAGIEHARAIVLTDDDDVGNLHAALAAQDLRPRLRIVLSLFNEEFGRRVERLFHDCAVLSYSAIAAPAFVEAALFEDWEQRFELAGRHVVLRQANATDPDVLLPLARLHQGGVEAGIADPPDLFPAAGDDLLCLTDGGPVGKASVPARARLARRPARIRLDAIRLLTGLVRAILATSSGRLRVFVGTLIALALISTFIFSSVLGLTPLDGVYFTITIMTTTGFGDINLLDAPPLLKIFGMMLMLTGATILAILYALIIDAVVGERLAGTFGAINPRISDHVVVCGLGNVGFRIVQHFVSIGVPVIAIELDGSNRFVTTARRLGVTVLLADARLGETLREVRLARARCLIVATNDDVANLETALTAGVVKPDLRVVLRLFDPDFAVRVERAFGISTSRSVSALAVPTYVAAAVGQRVIATVPVGPRSLLIAQAHVAAGSWADGRPVAGLEQATETRVLVLTEGDRTIWRPSGQTILRPDQSILVIATRNGLAAVWASTETEHPPDYSNLPPRDVTAQTAAPGAACPAASHDDR